MRSRQNAFEFPKEKRGRHLKEHGGEPHSKGGRRKAARPFDPTKRLHVTMRSSLATSGLSMLHPTRSRKIKMIVHRAAKRHGIALHRYVCVGNHLHFMLQSRSTRMIPARKALASFLREVSGLVARAVLGSKKGQPARRKFWDHLAWSRVIEWGRDLKGTYLYFEKNVQEFLWILRENQWPSPELPP